MTTLDKLLSWGQQNSLWVFPMATSCCGIEFMAAAASRFDMDRFGSIARGSPRHCDVMVVAGTITVKMAPRVKKLWDQMPEPKWCIAMGSCAISGDFYRDIYSVVPGVDVFLPVDVYVPGCPPNPEALLNGLRALKDKIDQQQKGTWVELEIARDSHGMRAPGIPRIGVPERRLEVDAAQVRRVQVLDVGGASYKAGTEGEASEAPVEEPAEDAAEESE
ncbi:MAG: NADH-quinone oxidoreductase subunit B [Proteobacteria bacterium]|nr:NADH-quinone oxidoreductase subunit B [Pseudomonadota bacterium]